MRFIPNIRYGTERYPEKVARRLRLVNVAACLGIAITTGAAITQSTSPAPGAWRLAVVNATSALVFMAVPLLHRYGPLTGAVVLITTAYAGISTLTMLMGTGTGVYRFLHLFPAAVVLLIGVERIRLAVGLTALGILLAVILEFVAPQDTGLVPPGRRFYGNLVFNVIGGGVLLFTVMAYAFRQVVRAEAVAEREYERSESLLVNTLPPRIARRLKDRTESEIADAYPEASILFADMAGFTARASDTTPKDLVRFLNGVYTRLDNLVERHGLEKIKTTGDAYMVVSGVPEPRPDHAAAIADLAVEMREALTGLVDPKGRAVPVRIGIASGPVVAGVVGTKRFFYDVWGDAVNTASRMESTGESGKIQIAPKTRELLADLFDLEERGVIDVRGKGPMRTWFLFRRKPPKSNLQEAIE